VLAEAEEENESGNDDDPSTDTDKAADDSRPDPQQEIEHDLDVSHSALSSSDYDSCHFCERSSFTVLNSSALIPQKYTPPAPAASCQVTTFNASS
jgi:hypothetical protein